MKWLFAHKLVLHLTLALLLVLVYPFQSLFSGNQNVYFLWGLAEAGIGSLQLDPLFRQADPFPLFSGLIFCIWTYLHPIFSFVIYWLLNTIYIHAVFGIADTIKPIYQKTSSLLLFSSMFFLLHASELWGSFLRILSNIDLIWIWDSGLAEQGVLRGYLQPSVFGVFLLLSVLYFLRSDPKRTFLSLAIAAFFHANYMFIGGLMGVVYFIFFIRKGAIKPALIWAAVASVIVLPYLIYTVLNFLPETASQSQLLETAVDLTKLKNPHLDLAQWMSVKTFFQIIILVVSLFTFRKSLLGKLLLAFSLIGLLLTIVAFITQSNLLFSLNPWRISVVVMPIATIILSWKIITSKAGELVFPAIVLSVGTVTLDLMAYRVFGTSDLLLLWRILTAVGLIISIGLGLLVSGTKLYPSLKPLFAIGLILSIVVSGIFGFLMDQRFRSQVAHADVAAFAKDNNDGASVFIIPTDLADFRMRAECAVTADKNLVYGLGLPSQMNRIHTVNEFYNSDWKSEEKLTTILTKLEANRLLVPAKKEFPPTDQLTELYRDEFYVVLGK